ncbi:NADPH-dependent F420 reductase [Pseudomonas gingeri]|uniref:NADPH-dependent F420 reductase n=1 Tax=Pseudomonas gingeri TaxID=117681 RepID=UPI001C433514|nr:NAD(P)-binding domain-containing protein [Pseudomonas gingeri]
MNYLIRRLFACILACALFAAATVANAQASAPNDTKPTIGIIGSGTVGGTLGKLFVAAGYPVVFSSRHPDELKGMAAGLGSLASVGTPERAAREGDIVLMAVPYRALPEIGQQLAQTLNSKIVIDATNAYDWRDGDLVRQVEEQGIGKVSAALLPGAKIVRAFNNMGTSTIAEQAHRKESLLAIPIAGDDKDAIVVVSRLITTSAWSR